MSDSEPVEIHVRERTRIRLAEEAQRRTPEVRARLAQTLDWEKWPDPPTDEQRAEADAALAAARAEADRIYGPRDDTIRIDVETHQKLVQLAMLGHVSPSEAVTDLIDDAYEQQEWSRRREMNRARARSGAREHVTPTGSS